MCSDDKEISKRYPMVSAQAEIVRTNIGTAFKLMAKDSCLVGKVFNALSQLIKKCSKDLFFLKLEQFVLGCNCTEEQMDEFLNKQTDEEKAWLFEFLMQKLYTSDEVKKCRLYGFVFKSIVTENLAINQAKRVCRAIERSFIEDISNLPKFKGGAVDSTELGTSLLNAELLIVTGLDGGNWSEETGGQIYSLSRTGELLLHILEINKWEDLLYQYSVRKE